MKQRIQKLHEQIRQNEANAFLLSNPNNMYYFSGFTGEGYVVMSEDRQIIITDSRYVEQAEKETEGFEVTSVQTGSYEDLIKRVFGGINKMAFEAGHLNVAKLNSYKKICPDIEFIPTENIGKKIRIVKDEKELVIMRKAASVTEEALDLALKIAKRGMKEYAFSTELEFFMAKEYNAKTAFDFIVASGPNGSLPHAVPSAREFQEGDLVTLDFGAKVERYCSDMTRTFALGEIDPELREIYEIVKYAHQMSFDALKPGARCREIDAIARDYITSKGYGKNFGHGLGHGVGLDIHELPTFSTKSEEILEKNMVVTIEPGIYIPGKGGVRIENTCVITDNGSESLFTSTKELITL